MAEALRKESYITNNRIKTNNKINKVDKVNTVDTNHTVNTVNAVNTDKEVQLSEHYKQRELIISKLKEKKLRITKQRLVIIDIILEEECSCCKEIYYKASKIDKKIGISTVYRMVNLLEEIGEINRGNIYKVESCKECDVKNFCCVKFDDNTVMELSETSWKHIVQVGLSICGYTKDKKVVDVKLG